MFYRIYLTLSFGYSDFECENSIDPSKNYRGLVTVKMPRSSGRYVVYVIYGRWSHEMLEKITSHRLEISCCLFFCSLYFPKTGAGLYMSFYY